MNHVFISYRLQSVEHAAMVRKFAEDLRRDVPVMLDKFYEEGHPGGPDDTWIPWCIEQAEKSACVLIVCSRGWFEAANGDGPADSGFGVAAEARIIQTGIFRKKSNNARMRLVILDDFDPDHVPDAFFGWSIFHPKARPDDDDKMRRWIRQRLAEPSSTGSQAGKIVYVAECHDDARTERVNLVEYLRKGGWQIRPDDGGPPDFAKNLRECVAYVQLLEATPAPDGSDATQLQQAQQADPAKPIFRFRHAKIQVNAIQDARHRDFVAEVRPGVFDDFKLGLAADLEAAWNRIHAPLPYSSRELLIRIVIRASEWEPLWDEVFGWIEAQPGMRPALLEGSESFKEKHNPEVPCHGFLIICDQAAQDGALSTKTDLEQCMEIQLGERNDARRPPVGMVYWPPPEGPKWSRLLRVSPLKLHRIIANAPAGLQKFFEDVRRCGT